MSAPLVAARVLSRRRFRVGFGAALLVLGPAAFTCIGFDLAGLWAIPLAWGLALVVGALTTLAPAAALRASSGPRSPAAPFANRAIDDAITRERAWDLASMSIWLPAVAVVFAGPLSLHAPFSLSDPGDYKVWIALSACIVPHAHVVLALLCWRFARRVLRGELKRPPAAEGTIAVLWATLAAAIPGIVLVGLPPALTLVTGMVFAPVMFWVLHRQWRWEEDALLVRYREPAVP